MELAHTQRLAVWAEHGQPKAYCGSDLMREDIKATIAEVERMAELIYNLHVAPSPQDVASGVPESFDPNNGDCPHCDPARFCTRKECNTDGVTGIHGNPAFTIERVGTRFQAALSAIGQGQGFSGCAICPNSIPCETGRCVKAQRNAGVPERVTAADPQRDE